MESFIFEVACIPADKNSLYEYAHVTAVAIAANETKAESMVLSSIISHSWIVEDVLLSAPLSILANSEKAQFEDLRLRAIQSVPPCRFDLTGFPKEPDGGEVRIYPLPDMKNHQC